MISAASDLVNSRNHKRLKDLYVMMTVLFLLAILLAIPTAGVSLLAFLVVFFGRAYLQAQSRMHFANERAAYRDVRDKVAPTVPTWINTAEEDVFFNGVIKMVEGRGVPITYIAQGFSLSKPLFITLAANMEGRGSSFIQQQMSVTDLIVGAWNDLERHNKDTFIKLAKKISPSSS